VENSGRFKRGNRPANARDWTSIDERIRRDYPENGSEIADELGLSRAALYVRAGKIGVACIKKQTLPIDQRRKISDALKGRIKSPLWCERLSESLRGRPHSVERVRAIVNGLTASRRGERRMTKPELKVESLLNSILVLWENDIAHRVVVDDIMKFTFPYEYEQELMEVNRAG
jgi:hypothetical protein